MVVNASQRTKEKFSCLKLRRDENQALAHELLTQILQYLGVNIHTHTTHLRQKDPIKQIMGIVFGSS